MYLLTPFEVSTSCLPLLDNKKHLPYAPTAFDHGTSLHWKTQHDL